MNTTKSDENLKRLYSCTVNSVGFRLNLQKWMNNGKKMDKKSDTIPAFLKRFQFLFNYAIVNKNKKNAREGIRTLELLQDWTLNPAPLT